MSNIKGVKSVSKAVNGLPGAKKKKKVPGHFVCRRSTVLRAKLSVKPFRETVKQHCASKNNK